MVPLLTVLIIPGAFFQPLHYQPLQQRLIAELHVNVQVLSLPSATSSAANLFVDAKYVAANIQETAGNIVPVAHSYGGIVLSQVQRDRPNASKVNSAIELCNALRFEFCHRALCLAAAMDSETRSCLIAV